MIIDSGFTTSNILIVGSAPNEEDIRKGYLFSGDNGKVLQAELNRAGLSKSHVTMLWDREPDKEGLDERVAILYQKMTNVDFVLLMGKELAEVYMDGKISGWYGLRVTSPLIPPNVKLVYAAPSPGLVTHGTVGEFRLSLEKFRKAIKEWKQ